ncbi:hypothetical protein D6789_03320, partial [Candidatus Woesearchaeota archaeon]
MGGWLPASRIDRTIDKGIADLLSFAYDYAWRFSDDPRTKNGAVLAKRSGAYFDILSFGANQFPPGTRVTQELLHNHEEKLANIIHAEDNCLRWAVGVPTSGLMMVSPWAPCYDCAVRIVDAGLEALYVHAQALMRTPPDWRSSIERGVEH